MNFHVMTLFPEMIMQAAQNSILGRAIKNEYITLQAIDIREYTVSRHKKVDDYPYGGGAGMLMQAQPVYDCCQAVINSMEKERKKSARVVYLTPQGKQFDQKTAGELAKEEDIIFLCGHYEGIDERVLEEIVTDYISIGDYVLTGGELPAMVVMDAVSRLVPGVLHNSISADFESFYNDLLEYPQYSRPEEWRGKRVPEILLSGDHAKIEKWRLEQARKRTKERRPDMYEKYMQKQSVIDKLLKKGKILYIDMIESLRRARGEVVFESEKGVIIKDAEAVLYMLAVFEEEAAEEIAWEIPKEDGTWQFLVHQKCLLNELEKRCSIESVIPMNQMAYTDRTPISLRKSEMAGSIRFETLDITFLDEVLTHYHMVPDEEYIEERLMNGCIVGAFIEDKLAGFAGTHQEGSIGMLEVYEDYRHQGIGEALEAHMINLHLSAGYTPYGEVVVGNHASAALQEKLKLKQAREELYWVIGKMHRENG